MRKLASIRVAKNIYPIAQADAIEAVQVDGWTCVSKKNEFKSGDLGVYFEIDSFLPGEDQRFSFLSKQFINFNNKQGARLRTIRLRGQLSQGLFLPISLFPEIQHLSVGSDVTEILKIEKWEAPIPTQLAGDVEGSFPSFISKSDQERVQNIIDELDNFKDEVFEVTIKLDGASMTAFRKSEQEGDVNNNVRFGICSRNWELRENDKNTYWRVARKIKLLEALDFLGKNYAFQGELIGEGIQENPEKIKGHDFYLYNIFDIDSQTFLESEKRKEVVNLLNENGFEIKHVPFQEDLVWNHSLEEILEMADGASLNPEQKREGLVLKHKKSQLSFKVISNWYLEKHKNR